MKILFVCSGNYSGNNSGISPIIINQGESLKKLGIDVLYFPITGKGFSGYLKGAVELRKYLQKNAVDVVHAHYSLCGWVAVLSLPKQPIVLSLMGEDAFGEHIGVNKIRLSSSYLMILTILVQPFVKAIISKSKNIERHVYNKRKSHVVPNGIDLEKVYYSRRGFKEELGLKSSNTYILFLGNVTDKNKNYKLAEQALSMISTNNVALIAPYPVPPQEVVKYLNSVDVLVVPSLMEGSPNLVKEAMACNLPVVATNVGDIAWLFGDEPGFYISDFCPKEVAQKIEAALKFAEDGERTNGRKRIQQLGLDSEKVALKIVNIYKEVLGWI